MRFVYDCPVRWSDMDAYGHVNNARFLTLYEEARVALLFIGAREAGLTSLEEGIVIFRHEVDYLRPVDYGRPVRIEMWIEEMRPSRFTVAYELFAGDELASRARSICVPFDLRQSPPAPAVRRGARLSHAMASLASPVAEFLGRLIRLDPAALIRIRGAELWASVPWGVLVTRTVSGLSANRTVSAAAWLAHDGDPAALRQPGRQMADRSATGHRDRGGDDPHRRAPAPRGSGRDNVTRYRQRRPERARGGFPCDPGRAAGPCADRGHHAGERRRDPGAAAAGAGGRADGIPRR